LITAATELSVRNDSDEVSSAILQIYCSQLIFYSMFRDG
jgi:hypothetical protein